jgi:GNAT superfamily N-acetyltransferase
MNMNKLITEPAKMEYIKPICDLIQEQAALGHFHEGLSMDIDGVRRGLEGQAEYTIKHNRIPIDNKFSKYKASKLYIAKIENQFVGFCWLAAYKEIDSYPNEIHMLAVRKHYRKKGNGRSLVQFAKKEIASKASLYARIYHKSTFMMSLVKSEGFLERESNAVASRLFVFEKS